LVFSVIIFSIVICAIVFFFLVLSIIIFSIVICPIVLFFLVLFPVTIHPTGIVLGIAFTMGIVIDWFFFLYPVAILPTGIVLEIAITLVEVRGLLIFLNLFIFVVFVEMWVEAGVASFPAFHVLEFADIAELLTSKTNRFWFWFRSVRLEVFVSKNFFKAFETYSPAISIVICTHIAHWNTLSMIDWLNNNVVARVWIFTNISFTVTSSTCATHFSGNELLSVILATPAGVPSVLITAILITISNHASISTVIYVDTLVIDFVFIVRWQCNVTTCTTAWSWNILIK